ncbi:MAG: LuxR C-terminal-related transcriptional regulator [Flavobacteriales bacterium]
MKDRYACWYSTAMPCSGRGFGQDCTTPPRLELVAEVEHRSAVERLVARHGATVALVQLEPPHADCLAWVQALARVCPGTGIVLLGELTDGLVQQALTRGARGVLHATTTPEEVVCAVRAVHAGGLHTNAWLRRQWQAVQGGRARQQAAQATARPSSREAQVLALACLPEGLTRKAMAQRMGITLRTVEFHLDNLFRKFQVTRACARWC